MTPILFLAILGLGVVLAAPELDPRLDDEWHAWKAEHNRTYTVNEERSRRVVWENNMKIIELHNQEYLKGKHNFTMRMNAFGDLTNTEFIKMLTGFQTQKLNRLEAFGKFLLHDIPKAVNWKEQGHVTPVKDQGYCGSSWAFSATGALEGQMFRKTGELVPLSEQNLIDCSVSYGNQGCHGGFMQYAFQYVKDNGSLATEGFYPYEGQEGSCRYNVEKSTASVRDFVQITASEEALMYAVAKVGPISAAIDASHSSFRFYDSGMYYEPNCRKVLLNHAVLVVAYGYEGAESDDIKYWLIKNSWGEKWGMEGYMKIHKDWNNHCGIATYATYPIM
ncbi:testin-2-like [Acomys russatus]|uniref:testin-2-like n=1 Tax=Acomys russatus TaxID=60746 RepID=UPI0021E2A5F1|nr:testin-2-like [Acomys russatus]